MTPWTAAHQAPLSHRALKCLLGEWITSWAFLQICPRLPCPSSAPWGHPTSRALSEEGNQHLLHLHLVLWIGLVVVLAAQLCLTLCDATPWIVAHQAPLATGFFRQEYWSGLPFTSPGDLPNPGIKPVFPALTGGFFTTEPPSHWTVLGALISIPV